MALREINLIASDILEKRFLLRHLLLWGGGLAAVIVLIGGVYLSQLRSLSGAREVLPGGEGLTAVLAARVLDINKAQAEVNFVHREWSQLGAVIATQRSYSSILAKLADHMNDRTWLKQLSVDPGRERTMHLMLLGLSRSQEALGDFIQRLSSDAMFRGVVLKYSQESDAQTPGGKGVQFHIECDIAGG